MTTKVGDTDYLFDIYPSDRPLQRETTLFSKSVLEAGKMVNVMISATLSQTIEA